MRLGIKIATIGSAFALAGGGVAYATIPDSGDGEYHACVKDSPDGNGHMVRMIDKDATEACSSGWTEKTWNQVGPTGPTGPAGATGPTGPAGSAAEQPFIIRQKVHVNFSANENTSGGGGDTCPSGYSVISTGWRSSGIDFIPWQNYSGPNSPLGGTINTWTVSGRVTVGDNPGSIDVFGYCALNVTSDAQP